MSLAHIDPFSRVPIAKLRVFDAAARQKSFVEAAKELGLTQGAVSRHIKALEAQIGIELFIRGPRGVVLTEGGDLLAEYVRRAIDELATGLLRLGSPRKRTTLVIISPRSFAWRVLSPRLASFIREYPWIDLRIDSHRYYPNILHAPGDVAIGAGKGNWGDLVSERLTDETVFPVCSGSVSAIEAPKTPTEAFFRKQILLHYAERNHWSLWLEAANLDPKIASVGPKFSETAMLLAAAEAGQGIGIARMTLVADALRHGLLHRPFPLKIRDDFSYYLLLRKQDVNRPAVKAFAEWIRKEISTLNDLSSRLT